MFVGAVTVSSFFVRCSICNRSFLRRSISTSRCNSSICLRNSSHFSSSVSFVVVKLIKRNWTIIHTVLPQNLWNFLPILSRKNWNLLFIDLFDVRIVHIQSMVLLFQILYAYFDIFIDLQPCVVHLTQCIVLFCQILQRERKLVFVLKRENYHIWSYGSSQNMFFHCIVILSVYTTGANVVRLRNKFPVKQRKN